MAGKGMAPGRRRRRGAGMCDQPRSGRGRSSGAGRGGGSTASDSSLTTRTAVRAVIAAGTYVAQDIRDADGLTRPMLRRAAIRMAVSRQAALRRLGVAYLRADPPSPDELPARPARPPLEQAGPHPTDASATGPVIDVDPATVMEVDDDSERDTV